MPKIFVCLCKVEDSLLKKFNAKELGEVFSKTESGNESLSASVSSSSSPMKNPNKPSSEPCSNSFTQENSRQILKNTCPAVKPSESEPIKSTLKESVIINPVVTNRAQDNGVVDSSSSSNPDSQKQKQVTNNKGSNAATSASSNGVTTSPVTAKVTPRQKPTAQPVFSIAPSAPISTRAPQSYRNAITGSNPPVIPSQPPVGVPSEHGLKFGSVTIETLNRDLHCESSQRELCVSSSVERVELQEEPQNSNTEEAVPEIEPSSLSSFQQSGLMSDDFPHLDIINELLEEDQNNGDNHSFFSRQYSLPDRASMSADVSPSWVHQPEAYYESFSRAYGSFVTPQVNVSAYSDSQIEMLRSQFAYLRANSFTVMPGVNVGDVNGYTMYGDRAGNYSANFVRGGVSNGYSTYYHGASPNGNMGSLQSLD
jgi:hypothetical protein